jgi:hypothetical protein
MRLFCKLPLRFRSIFRKGRVEQELSDELRFHLEKLIEEKIGKGMTPEEAPLRGPARGGCGPSPARSGGQALRLTLPGLVIGILGPSVLTRLFIQFALWREAHGPSIVRRCVVDPGRGGGVGLLHSGSPGDAGRSYGGAQVRVIADFRLSIEDSRNPSPRPSPQGRGGKDSRMRALSPGAPGERGWPTKEAG